MKTSELAKLVKDVLSIEPGLSLLRELEKDVSRPIFAPDEEQLTGREPSTNRIIWRNGQHDLVQRLRMFVELTPTEFKLIRQQEKEDKENDE